MIPLRQEHPSIPLAPGVRAGVILRTQATGNPAGFSVSPAATFSPRETEMYLRILAADLGVSWTNIRLLRQVHGKNVVERRYDEPVRERPAADAHWTAEPRLVLGVLVADCCPVVLASPGAGLVGVAHAGWRGAARGVVPALWEELCGAGATPGDIHGWIGPCAGPDEYEIGPEVARHFSDYSGALKPSRRTPTRSMLDVRRVIQTQLFELGMVPTSLSVSAGATIGDARYHSHRRDRIAAGRMIAFVVRGLDTRAKSSYV